MKTLKLTNTNHSEIVVAAVETLTQGGLVLFPTETTYGAGVDATNQAAIDKLLAYKARREGKPLSIAVSTPEMAEQYVAVNEQARQLYKQFLPGPVTVISQSKGVVADGVASEFGTLGVRIPDYDLVLKIVTSLGKPMTATSANASGEKRPYTIADVFENISDKQKNLIDLVIDAGTLPPNPPSTVIDTTVSTPTVFRQGAVKLADDQSLLKLASQSEAQTRDIAKRIMLKNWNDLKEKGLIIGLDGSLGMGKTIFAKGAAEFLQITDTITSPTYTYIEEYAFNRHNVTGQFYHLDLWKISSAEELQRLEIETLVGPSKVLIIEWFSQVEKWLQPVIVNQTLVTVTFAQGATSDERELRISQDL